MSFSSQCLSHVVDALQHDTGIAMKWFVNNGMEPNPSKFQFMTISPKPCQSISLMINESTTIESVDHIVMLGITIDNRLNFEKHVSLICKKAARQLNALARISRYLTPTSRDIVNRSFVSSNFSYSPLVWHFCGKTANGKVEKLHERSLRILTNDRQSSYDELLVKTGSASMLTHRLRLMLIEVFKYFKSLTPACLNEMFQIKCNSHGLRDVTRLVQPLRRTSTYGLRTISYVGPKLWNDLPIDFKYIDDMDLHDFKQLINNWNFLEDGTFNCYV